ncbi:MAG: tRNA (N(6)-L-threonylcarbamoyladenosine(37)-C(2))-methylthiotransferase MtaB [Parachlamydiales bacterium]|nr:tRNA (N(6)-L-threonylcarbamoyladenosine(37)-C(2))-methylthiotransferase MtaB [Parachlamydiales bacterium]
MNKKYTVATLGCRTNQYETQAFRDQLEAMGYVLAKDGEQAELCIVNTCTVTENADKDSRAQIRKLAAKHPGSKLVVTGCSADNRPDEIAQLPGVSKVVRNALKDDLVKDLFPEFEVPKFAIRQFEAHTRAFVKVQDGCNSFCTYCIIPYTRGRSRSRTVKEVVEEVKGLISNGYKEVVLTGINVGDFDGGSEKARLVDLIKEVDALPGLERLRLSSIDPDEVDEDLASAIVNGKNTCHSMHIVLQSGSNAILKRMNRKYTRQMFIDTCQYLISRCPDFTFTTDIIVGFPGETERDFEDTLEMMKQTRFANVHMFPYSKRDRTRAALYPNEVPHHIMQQRKALLLKEAEALSFSLRNDYVGQEATILVENRKTKENKVFGHTSNFLPVWIPDCSLESNQTVKVRLIDNLADGLVGEIII